VYGLSNWSTETFPLLQHRYQFLPELDGYLLSGMARVAKPDEEIFRIFLARFGRNAEDCVFIDDTQANVDAARRLGFNAILFTSARQLRVALVKIGVLNA
jgi:2-haloacid dehalogenase